MSHELYEKEYLRFWDELVMEYINDKNGKIMLEYYEEIISSNLLEKIENDLMKIDIGFYKSNKSNKYFTSLEDYTS